MSDITREGFKKIAYNLGEAYASIFDKLGDLNKNPAAILGLEATLCKLRGSTTFFNEDYSRPLFFSGSRQRFEGFSKFSSSDNVGLGLLSAYISKNNEATSLPFPTLTGFTTWNPGYYGPPSPEGFGQWTYSDLELSGVPYFDHARWISLYSGTSNRINLTYVFSISKNNVNGFQAFDPTTDLPIDLRFMYYNKLVQTNTGITWNAIDVNHSVVTPLNYLAYDIEDNDDEYIVKINIPNDLIYDPSSGPAESGIGHKANTWWHIVMFWGSKDPNANEDIVAFDSGRTEYSLSSNDVLVWNVKHFFDNSIQSKVAWQEKAINDSSEYSLAGDFRFLIAKNRTHFIFKDGGPNLGSTIPKKYYLEDIILGDLASSQNSISNFSIDLKEGEYQSALITVKPYDNTSIGINTGKTEYKFVLGPKFYSDFARADWENFEYFPKPDKDFIVLARLILKRANDNNYGALEALISSGSFIGIFNPLNSNIESYFANAQILWLEQNLSSFAIEPHNDPLISNYLMPGLFNSLSGLRYGKVDAWLRNSAAELLLYGSRTPTALVNSATELFNPNSFGSILFRQLLKRPYDQDLLPEIGEPTAFQFNKNEIRLIESITSLPPSTEMVRLNSDSLELFENKLNIENTFEIFLEPTENCTAADENAQGVGIGLDYTFRLTLEDINENLLVKDWYIMASKYLLTNQEYADRVSKEQSVAGYFRQSDLQNITEFATYGYAGLVPDLTMGSVRTLETRIYNDFDPEVGVVSTFQYDNKFVAVRDVSLNITTFTEAVPYWESNIRDYYNIGRPDPNPTDDFYSDSFTIAPIGTSGSSLESIGKRSEFVYDFSPVTLEDYKLHSNRYAIKFITSVSTASISNISLKLQADLFTAGDTSLSNTEEANIILSIFSVDSETNLPDTVIATSTNSILFSSLSTSYEEVVFDITANLNLNTEYFAVLDLSESPIGGDIEIGVDEDIVYDEELFQRISFQSISFESLSNNNFLSISIPVSITASEDNTTDQLTNTTGQINIVIFESDNGNLSDAKVSFTSANDFINFSSLRTFEQIFTFDASSITLNINSKYWIGFLPSERVRGGTINVGTTRIFFNSPSLFSLNLFDDGIYEIWNNIENEKAWMKVYQLVPEILAYFNRDDDFGLREYLPPPNLSRKNSALIQKEGSWAFTNKKFASPSVLSIYPRYLPGSEEDDIDPYYVKFKNDIWVSLRLMVSGKPKDYILYLPKNVEPNDPIQIGDGEEAESIVYMYIAKTQEELENGYHGAPAGDRLVIRST